jgi:hypothetical protein
VHREVQLPVGQAKKQYHEPEHYHKFDIDTIQFLQEGFPPDVFTGFAVGHVVKYIQRYQFKNGLNDLIKAQDYINRLIDWHEKNLRK